MIVVSHDEETASLARFATGLDVEAMGRPARGVENLVEQSAHAMMALRSNRGHLRDGRMNQVKMSLKVSRNGI